MRSSKGKVAGGYLHIKWLEKGDLKHDDKAFVITVDDREKYRPTDPNKAVMFYEGYGPLFGRRSLGVMTKEDMNAANNVYCCTNGGGGYEFYNV
jgi:hypothetical protein